MKIGSGFKSTPLRSKDMKNPGLNGSPRANLFNKESFENTDPNLIDSKEQAPPTANSKQNGSVLRQDSLNDDDDDDEENPFFNFHNESKDAEELYSEALLDELKQLQVS